jgi:hypothetical protein
MLHLKILARRWWLTPVILATQEAEIRRIAIRSQPWALNSLWDPSLKKIHHKEKKMEWLKVQAKFKPHYLKKKERKQCATSWRRGTVALGSSPTWQNQKHPLLHESGFWRWWRSQNNHPPSARSRKVSTQQSGICGPGDAAFTSEERTCLIKRRGSPAGEDGLNHLFVCFSGGTGV